MPPGKTASEAALPWAKPNETILLVEDNADVREYARDVLLGLGYGVRDAASVQEALRIVAKKPVSVSGSPMCCGDSNGPAPADKVLQGKSIPHLPVLFTTSYTHNAIVHQGGASTSTVHLLNKPFTQQDLARKAREPPDAAEASHLPQASS